MSADLRTLLRRYFGTTDPDLLAEIWKKQESTANERNASAEPRKWATDTAPFDIDAIEHGLRSKLPGGT